MKKICKLLLLASAFQPALAADQDSNVAAEKSEAASIGFGALIGGLIAGPPGIVIGAAGGTLYGQHTGNRVRQIASLEQQLHDKEIDLALLQNEFTRVQAEYAGNLQKTVTENRQAVLEKLTDAVSFSVYFRTNESHVDSKLTPHIQDLVNLIRDVPDIKILLEAHADERGLPSYNLQLSRARAMSVQRELVQAGLGSNRIIQHAFGESRTRTTKGDVEGYMFDRRVDIHLTLDTGA